MKNTVKSGWRKYTNIITAIVLLLIVTLLIIGLSYYNTQQINKNTGRINAAARLSTITQDIKNDVYNIDIYAKNILLNRLSPDGTIHEDTLLQYIDTEAKKLNRIAGNFDHTLETFQHGGELRSESGSVVKINALSDRSNQKLLHSINEIWEPYHRLIDNVINSLRQNHLNSDAVNFATDYARIFNDRLSALSDNISDNLTQEANEQSKTVRLWLIIGFLLAILITVYLILIAFRQLIRSERALERSRRELNNIMDTITEGLFLVDRDLNIGEQHSAELERILHVKDIAHRSLLEVLKGRVSERDLSLTEGFLEQLFRKDVYDDLIKALNPLNRIHIMAEDISKLHGREDIYLSFSFHRVFEGKKITNVLVSVRDITENVMLEQYVEQQRIENEARMEMLSTILQVDNDLMDDFLQHIKHSCDEINTILKFSDNRPATLKEKLRQISRTIHGVKGESSALSLESFTGQLEKIEDDIAGIRQKSSLTGNDFLGLTVRLDELLTMHDKARQLFDKLVSGRFSQSDLDAPTPSHNALAAFLRRFAEQIAERNGGKHVQLECSGLDDSSLSSKQSSDIREMSLQLMRNAIVHGIEVPNKRSQMGKSETGHITIELHLNEQNQWIYTFSDDGAGINYDALRAIATKHPHYKDRNPQTLTHQELTRLMFDNGVSTATKPGEDAGRGVGMDVIRAAIRRLHGKLHVQSVAGQFTRFTVQFPNEENNT